LSSIEESIEIVSALGFEVPNKIRYELGIGNPYEEVYMVRLHDKADDCDWIEALCPGEG
jgi:hypothetical protein